jgi:hypothetical protein
LVVEWFTISKVLNLDLLIRLRSKVTHAISKITKTTETGFRPWSLTSIKVKGSKWMSDKSRVSIIQTDKYLRGKMKSKIYHTVGTIRTSSLVVKWCGHASTYHMWVKCQPSYIIEVPGGSMSYDVGLRPTL